MRGGTARTARTAELAGRRLGAALLLAVAACTPADGGGAGRFTPARLVSAETENGATPMFLVTPAGQQVLAWVSAPGGGEDGRLHVIVTPPGQPAGAPATLTDPLGPIDTLAWGAGVIGVVLGLAVAFAFASSTGMLG